MKIGILTLPLTWNYGGILQAYALSKKLLDMGHDPVLISRRMNRNNPISRFIVWWKWWMIKYAWYIPFTRFIPLLSVESFKKKYLKHTTKHIFTDKTMHHLTHDKKYNAFIVGSDQVWNYGNPPHLGNFYLDFTHDMPNIKRIAFSASFGKSEWTYSEEDTLLCSNLSSKFDAISVREDSGVKLCKQHLQQPAIHLLDPTFLHSNQWYETIIKNEKTRKNKGSLFTYILDSSPDKAELISTIEGELKLNAFTCKQEKLGKSLINFIKGHTSSVEQWLCGFRDAKFVITDSFHGTVFAIIFNKPFLSIANKKRGLSRFESLLNTFNLSDRLIYDYNDILQKKRVLHEVPDWDEINAIITRENLKSEEFLQSSIG